MKIKDLLTARFGLEGAEQMIKNFGEGAQQCRDDCFRCPKKDLMKDKSVEDYSSICWVRRARMVVGEEVGTTGLNMLLQKVIEG